MILLQRISRFLSDLGMAAAVVILLAMTALILVEIGMRTGFARSTHMADELVGYGIAAMSFLALGQSLERRSLLRMNLLLGRLDPKGAPRRAVEVVCILFGLFASGLACFYFARSSLRNYERGYVSETVAEAPLWLPESFVVAGLAIFWLQLLAYLGRVLSRAEDLSVERAADLGAE